MEHHSRNKSYMNQRWSWHSVDYIKPKKWIEYLLEHTITKKINTKNYECSETNEVQVTNCLDEFYMSKMNCSFPWLKSYFGSLEKCGNKHHIGDLKALIDNVVMDGKFHPDFKKCLVPNCVATTWKSKQNAFDYSGETWYMSLIDSNLKVNSNICFS